jgi:hypothetical protein
MTRTRFRSGDTRGVEARYGPSGIAVSSGASGALEGSAESSAKQERLERAISLTDVDGMAPIEPLPARA